VRIRCNGTLTAPQDYLRQLSPITHLTSTMLSATIDSLLTCESLSHFPFTTFGPFVLQTPNIYLPLPKAVTWDMVMLL
jgi:hypothetical protein